MSVAALIVAAGRGSRAGDGIPKQYRPIGGRPVLARALDAFLRHPGVGPVAVVIHPDDEALFRTCLPPDRAHRARVLTAFGGDTRQESVRLGLDVLLPSSPARILVHDGARPFVDSALIDRAIAAADRYDAAVPGIAVTDTIKLIDATGAVSATPDRDMLRAIQTPQVFAFRLLHEVHRKAHDRALPAVTDDGALIEAAGHPVHVFEGSPANIKLTHPADFIEADRRLAGAAMTYTTRLGTGFDVHAFGDGDHVMLGGIPVPHDRGVLAHSDGDVVLHALTDAVLGALADGDIGTHFPPSDPQWRGASSDRFLAHAVALVRERGGIVDHLDATLLCERPKLGPYREPMRKRIAEIAGLRLDQVSLKATTTERLGFTGRGEGIAAQAAATIRLPEAGA